MPQYPDSRKILKVFGVTVTEFEEAAKDIGSRLEKGLNTEDLINVTKQALALLLKLNSRFHETWGLVVGLQNELLNSLSRAYGEDEES